jgi:superoxide dismutase, Cu-Zn family
MPNPRKRIVAVIVLIAAVGGWTGVLAAAPVPQATASLIDTNGLAVGSVTFKVVEGKMAVTADVVLPRQFAGFHGFHLHRIGKCETAAVDPASGKRSPFFTASGHIGSEDGHHHGLHDGDLPPLLVNRDGHARMIVRTDHISFDRLFDADGTAVILHLDRDNLAHVPARYAPNGADAATLATGDAGGRTACGLVRRG